MALKTLLVMIVLGMSNWSCAGFPVYDYNLASLRQALAASVADVNARSLSPYLLRAFGSSVKRVNVLDENNSSLDIEFSVRETTCRRDSGADPATCDFQSGYYVPIASCRSTVWMSADQVQDVWVLCRWSSSSESDSSEEHFVGIDFVVSVEKAREIVRSKTSIVLALVECIDESRWFSEVYWDPLNGEAVIHLISFLTNPDVNSFMNGRMSLCIPFLSLEIMRRVPPGDRRYPNQWHRARVNTGFE
ncbi:hypothetical protein QTO34_002801 [Cnephaeus nilssonii]|uniref:Secreted phosphoprotein 24 n=1 Tax=Cnephaeus nilssonii TaxID=3371016 RepID=A0AA40LKH4_CNENI|nr:hypothetical protein QTO34_002801 [Eptesicus nilssonii]